jgi:hypothetical protein
MKRTISMLLAVVMLLSLGTAAWAEEDGITAEKVYQWLEEGDEASETTEDQAANGALRLAEMTVVLDSLSAETDHDVEHLNNILDKLAEVDVPGESYQRKLAIGLIKTFEGLVIFEQQQIDREGKYESSVDQIFDSFSAGDEKTQNATEQAVNALYHSVYMASLIAQQLCPNQKAIAQIQEEMTAFAEGESAAAGVSEQLVNGGETLFRLLTAIASMNAPDDSFSEDIHRISENNYAAAEEESDKMFLLANWLYGSVHMTGLIVEEMQA